MAEEAYRKALQLLARRPHFEREIRRKLEARGFDVAVCEDVVSRLSEEKLLDDERAAVGFVESKLRRGPVGSRRLRADLV
ncbi:MAG: RecX family transcriptional regulator, partial [Thermoanaerobaculia bacterium]|nr:RecX family transcriptional regulator [Thermoanaerobaculia bacterium]